MGGLNEGLGPIEQLRWLFLNDADFHALAVLIEPYWAMVYRATVLQEAYDELSRHDVVAAQRLRAHALHRYDITLRMGY